jgi:hypothetical protein
MDTLERVENFWISLEARILLEKPTLDRELTAILQVHRDLMLAIVAIQHESTIGDPADRARANLATRLIAGYLDTLSGIELEEATADLGATVRRIAAATGHLFDYPDQAPDPLQSSFAESFVNRPYVPHDDLDDADDPGHHVDHPPAKTDPPGP